VPALKFQQLTRKCIVMLNFSHKNLIQKLIGIRNASALLQNRKKKKRKEKRKRKGKKGKRDFCKMFLEQIL